MTCTCHLQRCRSERFIQPMSTPSVSVVVPSHGRRLRLRWLLNALEEQSLDADLFEVIVVHDYEGADAELLSGHPLATSGRLRPISIPPGTGGPARQRNIGWRMAVASLVAFIDDDCRPETDWLAELLAAARRHPGAIVQGKTRPDPFEMNSFASPHARSLWVNPPHEFGQTCNIAYPTEVLVRVGGFDEDLPAPAGEDTDLALRARATGAGFEGAENAVVNHAVEAYSLPAVLRLNLKWRHLAFVVKRHPELRRHFTYWAFWRRSHLEVLGVFFGLALSSRQPAGVLFCIPWTWRRLTRRGRHKRAVLAGMLELPGGLIVDGAEVGTMCWGSLRYRTLVL